MGIGEASRSSLQGNLRMMDPGSDDGLGADDWLDSMRGDRERLQRLLNHIQAKLQDARQMQIGSESMALQVQLKELEGLAADIEDLLDDFEYEKLRLLVEGGGGGRCSSGADCSLLEQSNQGSVRDVMASRIADIRRRYDDMKTDWEFFNLLPKSDEGATTQMKANSRETSSFPTNIQVLGRDRVKEEIVEFLVGSPEESLSVVGIVGIGGVGKTTLARFIYNDEKISGHFDEKIWVHVSCDFDVKKVTRQILERVAGPQSNLHQMNNLDVLQTGLAETVKDKKCLLVLDDMWYEDQTIDNVKRWDALCAPLLWGGKGSKILVTTRHAQVVVGTSRRPVKTIELKGLEFEASWSLFEKHAFVDDGNSGRHPNLENIGKRIVSKLQGVPLAVVTVGSMLYSESEESGWMSVLNSELWELEQGEGDILPALRLSYERLPAHLKPCFAHFSAFGKGLNFDKPELLQLWMASGHIKSQGRKRAEDVGNDYLSCLLSRSLVQSVDGKYYVHDLLHDMGRSILRHDSCHREIDQLHTVPEEDQQKHHLSLRINRRPALCELEKLQGFRKLCTCSFIFSYKGDFQIPFSLFENLACLRVLDLSGGGMQVLPDSVGRLRHLRYLDLRETPIRYLPDSLCTLYMLQTLKLQGCDQLSRLPDGISNLINLRHLEARPELVSGISGFGKLTHLQQLEVFCVSKGDGIKIRDLREMDELRGKLCIQNLQRVVSKEEACVANLTNKKYIRKLKLEWVEDGDVNKINSEFEEAVLEALLPPQNLKELTIVGYGGSGFPSWMEHCGLERISLSRCRRWGALPPLTGRLSTLRNLKIVGLPQLTELPPLPPPLTDLRLVVVGLNRVSELQNLHQLNHLCLFHIPNLKELPPLPTTLKNFAVANLGLESLPDLCQDHKGQGGEGWDGKGPSLVSLWIAGCQNLRSLGGVLRHHLLYLDRLSIKDCEELMSWPEEEGFRATLQSLQGALQIEGCPKLLPLPVGSVLPPSLKKLKVRRCPRFVDRSLFAQIQNLHTALTKSGDLHVENRYQDLMSCSEDALQQVNHPIRVLIIRSIDLGINEGGACSFLFVRYATNNRRVYGWSSEHYPLLSLGIHSRRNVSNGGVDHNCITLFTCLHLLHHLCSSLHTLCISGVPNSAFLIEQGVGGGGGEAVSSSGQNLLLLEWLQIADCRDMGRLPVETLLCHLRQLKTLAIRNCPELTLSSVEEAIRFLPSLRRLELLDCPRMSEQAVLVSDANNSGGSSSFSSSSSSSTSTSPPPQLQVLCTDNIAIPSNGKFARDCLASLNAVIINGPKAGGKHDEEWPRSIRRLFFVNCPDLEELPPNLGRLVPSLDALLISGCPKLRCVPERGLPPSLALLSIQGSPGVEEADWPKVAHVRVIYHDDKLLQGSINDFEEVRPMLNMVV